MSEKNKYTYINQINFNTLFNNKGKIIQVYPETKDIFAKTITRGCSSCKKKRIKRGILLKIIELGSEGRDLTPLQGVLPIGLLELL